MSRRTLYLALVITLILISYWPMARISAQSGVLLPTNITNHPDVLSLSVMNVDILIDNQYARVKVLQIFDNHYGTVLEGKYTFGLPITGTISDFAIWENNVRIPGVIMEKRRAEAVYGELTNAKVDPGLLQQDDEHGGSSAFSVKVFPIPAYGSKRLELEYTENLEVEELTSRFSFPLKPEFGYSQEVGELNIHVTILSNTPIANPEIASENYKMQVLKSTANEFEAVYKAKNIKLEEDLELSYKLDVVNSQLNAIAYRAPEHISAYDLRDPALAKPNPDGYFQTLAVFNEEASQQKSKSNVLILLDTSLSMYGDKLVQAVSALEMFLNSLTPESQFNLVLFNETVTPLANNPLPATKENIAKAMSFVTESWLYGGTDLHQALSTSLKLINAFPAGNKNIILISDANTTIGQLQKSKIIEQFNKSNNLQARLFALGLSSDAANNLLEQLVKDCNGYALSIHETEDINFPVQSIIDKTQKSNISNLSFDESDKNFYQVYATSDKNTFDQSSYSYVGRYRKPQAQATVSVKAFLGNRPINLFSNLLLPEFDDTHAQLPRIWARARVDALLREMDIYGEREDYIAEIIRLAQKYKFVTPYTSFIAAPRALLRPRLIQPGDPVIRVKTDESIKAVFAVLPFGETLPLKYLAEENVWEGRFFAPANMPDGSYKCRLLLTDKHGQGFQEEKSFVIDSHAPKLEVKLAKTTLQAGDELTIKANADKDTIRLIAKLSPLTPINLRWSNKEQINIGKLQIPNDLPAGNYTLSVIAEDGAYNQSSQDINLVILPR